MPADAPCTKASMGVLNFSTSIDAKLQAAVSCSRRKPDPDTIWPIFIFKDATYYIRYIQQNFRTRRCAQFNPGDGIHSSAQEFQREVHTIFKKGGKKIHIQHDWMR